MKNMCTFSISGSNCLLTEADEQDFRWKNPNMLITNIKLLSFADSEDRHTEENYKRQKFCHSFDCHFQPQTICHQIRYLNVLIFLTSMPLNSVGNMQSFH